MAAPLSWECISIISKDKHSTYEWQRSQLFSTVTVYLALCKVKYTVKMLSIGLVLAIGSLTGTLACENTTLPDGTTCPPTGNHVRSLQITAII